MKPRPSRARNRIQLAEIMKRPHTRKLYRGLSGMRLPDRLFKEDPLGWKGAVEVAFMSCTLKRDVALQYIGDAALPILFEIETSQIDRGGCKHHACDLYMHSRI